MCNPNNLDRSKTTMPNIPPRKYIQKRVRFHENEESSNDDCCDGTKQHQILVVSSAPPLFETLSEEICQRLWFQDDEILSFRAETRRLILCGKQSDDDDLGGLERFNLERSARKKVAIRLVLLAQRKGGNPEFIQGIATECSQWAVTAGLLQGFQDFCQVYDPLASLLGAKGVGEGTYNEILFGNVATTTNNSNINVSEQERLLKKRNYQGATMMKNTEETLYGNTLQGFNCRQVRQKIST